MWTAPHYGSAPGRQTDADVAEGHLDRLYLAGIVQTEKHDLLSGREIYAFHRAHRAAEFPRQAQLGDGPHDLRIDGRSQCIAVFTENAGVDQRIFQEQQNDFNRNEGRLTASAPAFLNQLVDLAGLYSPVRFRERRGDHVREFTGRQ